MHGPSGVEMDTYLETAIFLQISNSSAILILSARTVSFFFTTTPAWQLLFSTALGQVIVNVWIIFFAGRLSSSVTIPSTSTPQNGCQTGCSSLPECSSSVVTPPVCPCLPPGTPALCPPQPCPHIHRCSTNLCPPQ